MWQEVSIWEFQWKKSVLASTAIFHCWRCTDRMYSHISTSNCCRDHSLGFVSLTVFLYNLVYIFIYLAIQPYHIWLCFHVLTKQFHCPWPCPNVLFIVGHPYRLQYVFTSLSSYAFLYSGYSTLASLSSFCKENEEWKKWSPTWVCQSVMLVVNSNLHPMILFLQRSKFNKCKKSKNDSKKIKKGGMFDI